jgi:hypothetical protein
MKWFLSSFTWIKSFNLIISIFKWLFKLWLFCLILLSINPSNSMSIHIFNLIHKIFHLFSLYIIWLCLYKCSEFWILFWVRWFNPFWWNRLWRIKLELLKSFFFWYLSNRFIWLIHLFLSFINQHLNLLLWCLFNIFFILFIFINQSCWDCCWLSWFS